MRSELVKGILIGVAVGASVPLLLPAMVRSARPLGRALLRSGLIAVEKGRETLEELVEVVDDMVAEARQPLEPDDAMPEAPRTAPERENSDGPAPQ